MPQGIPTCSSFDLLYVEGGLSEAVVVERPSTLLCSRALSGRNALLHGLNELHVLCTCGQGSQARFPIVSSAPVRLRAMVCNLPSGVVL